MASAVMAGLLLVVAGGNAGGQVGPVTEYDAYPPALPDGCPDGSSALVDVRWRNGAGQEATSLDAFTIVPGETFTVTWSAFAPGCLAADGDPAIAVSTKVYDAVAFPFDRTVNQRLLDGWSSCGAGVGPCPTGDGRFALSVTLPSNDVTCVVQFGLAIGLPLAVVGPDGSYYNSATRGDDGPNMLVAARNYEIENCVAPSTTAAPTTTAAAALPTTGTQPPSSARPSVSAPAAPDNAALDNAVTAPAGPLPFTGASLGELTAIGLAVGLGGALLVLATRRPIQR